MLITSKNTIIRWSKRNEVLEHIKAKKSEFDEINREIYIKFEKAFKLFNNEKNEIDIFQLSKIYADIMLEYKYHEMNMDYYILFSILAFEGIDGETLTRELRLMLKNMDIRFDNEYKHMAYSLLICDAATFQKMYLEFGGSVMFLNAISKIFSCFDIDTYLNTIRDSENKNSVDLNFLSEIINILRNPVVEEGKEFWLLALVYRLSVGKKLYTMIEFHDKARKIFETVDYDDNPDGLIKALLVGDFKYLTDYVYEITKSELVSLHIMHIIYYIAKSDILLRYSYELALTRYCDFLTLYPEASYLKDIYIQQLKYDMNSEYIKPPDSNINICFDSLESENSLIANILKKDDDSMISDINRYFDMLSVQGQLTLFGKLREEDKNILNNPELRPEIVMTVLRLFDDEEFSNDLIRNIIDSNYIVNKM